MKFFKKSTSLALAAVMAWSVSAMPSASAASVKSAVSDGETLTVTISSDESETAKVYYKDSSGSVSMADAALTSGDTVVTLAGSGDGTLYVWDENMRPLTDVFEDIELSTEEATESEEATDADETGDGIIHLLGDSVNATGVENVEVDGTTVTVTAAGEYTFEGTLNDGQIVVSDDVGKKDAVTINLNGVTVTSSTSAPFNAANGVITVALGEGTVNTFTDTSDYTSYTTSKAPKGCFYSKRDMDITGAGTLVVNANVKNGIVCGADLSIKKNASLTVTAVNNAIKGDNSVSFSAKTGAVTVYAAEGDAIKSDAIDSDTGYIEDGKGTVEIKGGTFVLEAPAGDGIQADASVTISGGTLDITSGNEGIKANEVRLVTIDDDDNVLDTVTNGNITISGGTISITSSEDGIKAAENVTISDGEFTIVSTTDAIQAGALVDISGGTFSITSTTEAIKANGVATDEDVDGEINANGCISISGGTFTINAGEDGIKATSDIDVTSGTITIKTPRDGFQAGESGDTGTTLDSAEGTQVSVTSSDCTFSQQPESANPGSNAVDGDSSTVWASQGTATAVIDLGSEMDITCVGVQFKKYEDSRTIPYSVAVSDDNSSYTTIYSGSSVAYSGDMIYVSINQNARYVKFTFEGNTVSGRSSVAELEVYTGEISSSSVSVEGTINISGGTIDITTTGNTTDSSSKGIKSLTELNITGGDITVDSYDDAIHSNYNITITGGNMTLASDDDGIHADYVLTLGTSGGSDDDFEINITDSYEGIEASVINLLSGTTYIVSSDDGVNAAGDYDEDGTTSTMSLMAVGGNPGGNMGWNTGGQGWNQQDQGMDDTSSYGMLYIKGGLLYVVASGDGLDSNGDIEMSGGTVVVNGPTSSDNGVFDYGDTSSNYFKITGGTLVGVDKGGMSVNVSVSGQGSYTSSGSSGGMFGGGSSSSGSAGTAVKITTDSGNLVFIPEVSWSYIFVTSPDMTSGRSYSVSTATSYSGGTTLIGRTINSKFYGLIENAN